jgi:cytochrome c oxidase subunit II
MRQRARLTFVFALLGAIALVAAGCGGDDEGSGGGGATTTGAAAAATTTTGAAGGGGQEIKLVAKDTTWDTDTLDMQAGTEYTVEVDNQDTIEHNFTFADASANMDVEGGEDIKVTFTAPAAGSYEFHCKYHPAAMKGTVTVT